MRSVFFGPKCGFGTDKRTELKVARSRGGNGAEVKVENGGDATLGRIMRLFETPLNLRYFRNEVRI